MSAAASAAAYAAAFSADGTVERREATEAIASVAAALGVPAPAADDVYVPAALA